MPTGEEGDALSVGMVAKGIDLRQRGAGRFFQKNMQTVVKRRFGGMITDLRRRAEYDGIDLDRAGQQSLERREVWHAQLRVLPTNGGGQNEILISGYGGHMLVPRDFADADADDRDADRHQSASYH